MKRLKLEEIPSSLQELEEQFSSFKKRRSQRDRAIREGASDLRDWNDKYDVIGLTPNHWISPIDFTPVGWIGKGYKGGKMIYNGAKLVKMGLSGFGKVSIKAGAKEIFKSTFGKVVNKLGGDAVAKQYGRKKIKERASSVSSLVSESSSDETKSYQRSKKSGGGNNYTPKVEGRCRKGFYYDKRRKICIRRKKR